MKLRTCAEVVSNLPDDQVEVGGEIVRQGGANVAAALQDILRRIGCDLGPVEDAGDHGWVFDFSFRDRRLWCQVTDVEVKVVVFQDRGGSPAVAHPDFRALMAAVAEVMAADNRFASVGWFYPDEVLSGEAGAARPDDGAIDAVEQIAPALLRGPWSDLAPHPIRRCAARLFDDYLVSAPILVIVFALVGMWPPIGVKETLFALSLFLFCFPVRAIAGVVFNVAMLRRFSTTPGKWLCGIRVVRKDGGPPTLHQARKRELEAAFAGCAFYIPIISTVAIFANGRQLIDSGATSWDEGRDLLVLQRPDSLWQAAVTLVLLAPVVAVHFAFWSLFDG